MVRSVSVRAVESEVQTDRANSPAQAQLNRFQRELEFIQRRKDARVNLAERQYGKDSRAYRRAQDRFEAHKEMFDQVAARLNRPLKQRQIAGWIYASVAIVLSLLEAPVNKFIFDVILQSIGAVSWIVSFLVGLILFVVAHLNGTAIRHIWSERNNRIILRNCSLAVFFTAAILLFVVVLAVARWRYSLVGDVSNIGALIGNLANQLKTLQGIILILQAAFSDSASQTLAAVNSSAIIVAMFLSFITHDPDEDYDFASRNMDRAEKKLAHIEKKYHRKMANVNEKYEPNIERLGEEIAAAQQRVLAG